MAQATLSNEQIREMAKARVEFKQHLAAYVIINAMLIGIWGFTSGWQLEGSWTGFWPMWTLLFWGVGLAFHGVNAYGVGSEGMVSKEEAKLREKFGR